MASTVSSVLKIELQADGENENTWGLIANRNFETLERAGAGHLNLAIAGATTTLTATANQLGDWHYHSFKCTGTLTANSEVIVPNQSRVYLFENATTGSFTLTVKTAAGTGVAIPTGRRAVLTCDGTNVTGVVLHPYDATAYLPLAGGTLTGNVGGTTFRGGAGTAATPTFSFTGDTDTGIFSDAADQLKFTAGGTLRLTMSSTQLTSTGIVAGTHMRGGAGTAGAPSLSFTTDTNTGLYSSAADVIAFATNGAGRFFIGNAVIVPTVDLIWDSGTNRYIGYKGVTEHAAGNVGDTTFGVSDGGNWVGMVVTNFREGAVNSQQLDFKTAKGGVALTTTRMRILSEGYVLTGAASPISNTTPGWNTDTTLGAAFWPSGRTFISQDSFSNWNQNGDGVLIGFSRSGLGVGSITVSTTATSYNTSSDHRLKTEVEPLTGALDRLAQLQPKRFRWIATPDAPKVDGFLAHEAQVVVPEAVTGEKDAEEFQQIDQAKLVPLIVAALQELREQVEVLTKRLEGI